MMKVHAGFSEQERILRKRMIDLNIRQKDIADATGIHLNDVSNVVRGRSRSPRYIAEVYKFLDVELPDDGADETAKRA